MKLISIYYLFLLFVLLLGGTICSRSQSPKRFINESDLFEFQWIGDPQISPAGSKVVFYRVWPNKERNGYDSSIWMVDTGGRAG